jgi:hypothetical protein
MPMVGGSQWPHGLKRGSTAARLLGLWSRIPLAAGMRVYCVVYCQVEVSASSWSLVLKNPTECSTSECDREVSIMRRSCPTRGCCAMEKRSKFTSLLFKTVNQVTPMVCIKVNIEVKILRRKSHAVGIPSVTYRRRQILGQRALLL